jgi:hypothetical protein
VVLPGAPAKVARLYHRRRSGESPIGQGRGAGEAPNPLLAPGDAMAATGGDPAEALGLDCGVQTTFSSNT